MALPEPEILNHIVGRVFKFDDVTLGEPLKNYIARYHGQLLIDSVVAYDQLAEALRGYDIMPLFRIEDGRQTVILVRSAVRRIGPTKITTNVVLFLLTLVTVLLAGTMYSYQGPLPEDGWGVIMTLLLNIWVGWPFAVSLLSILLAHEFGHYFAGRLNKVAVTLPYFIPFPLPPLGTMGAVIQLKERPRNKRVLLDIGITGPLAGLVVAIPVLILGLSLSEMSVIENTTYTRDALTAELCPNTALLGEQYSCATDDLLEGNSILYLGLKLLVKGELLPAPVNYEGPPVGYWLGFILTGHPIPFGGRDVMLHPVAMAGWAGLLVTFLNLIPAGQLDGGHVLFALFGKRARNARYVIMAFTILLGFFWNGWWLWTALIYFFGRTQAEPLDEITALDTRRKLLGVLVLLVFLLVLTPVPFVVF
ncbi:MAG: site-2 protease family protein [Anaerolineales bacterium]|nr:site-2 protease family protein [Anaerolineales bacterium]